MHPSYSIRRGRLTAQLTCRTGTSYTPVKYTLLSLLSNLYGDIKTLGAFAIGEQYFLALK